MLTRLKSNIYSAIKRMASLNARHILMLGACISLPAQAEFYVDENLRLSGFATIGASRYDEFNSEDVDMSRHVYRDIDQDWNFRPNSKLGLQAHYTLNDSFSFAAQAISQGYSWDPDISKFEPELEWLFGSYQHDPFTRFRVGRLRTPLYLFSDTLHVGYSYAWARLPTDMYSPVISSLAKLDGVDALHLINFDESELEIQTFAGVSEGKVNKVDLDHKLLLGANFTYRWENLKFRYGFTVTKTDVSISSLDPIIAGYEQFAEITQAQIFQDLADSHKTEDSWFHYHSLGAQWDIDNWSIISEAYASIGPDKDVANDAFGGYISTIYQYGIYAPYITLSYNDNQFAGEIERLINSSEAVVPTGQVAPLDGLRQANLDVVHALSEDRFAYILGLRIDFYTNVALKLEAQFTHVDNKGPETTPPQPDRHVLTNIILDMVF